MLRSGSAIGFPKKLCKNPAVFCLLGKISGLIYKPLRMSRFKSPLLGEENAQLFKTHTRDSLSFFKRGEELVLMQMDRNIEMCEKIERGKSEEKNQFKGIIRGRK